MLPLDCSGTREHTVAVSISPPTLDSRGKCRGHHPTGWTNERTIVIVIAQQQCNCNLIVIEQNVIGTCLVGIGNIRIPMRKKTVNVTVIRYHQLRSDFLHYRYAMVFLIELPIKNSQTTCLPYLTKDYRAL